MKKTRKAVSKRVAALIIACSALTPVCVYNLYEAIQPDSPPRAPVVKDLGGFDEYGLLEGLTIRVGGHTFVCGGATGSVRCLPQGH
jgi:hypothetical protein